MENRKFVKFLIPIFILGFFVVSFNSAFAYSIETHAFLTNEIIKFYNQNFPNQKITDNLKDYLIDGVRREDDPVRWMNHFFDPIYDRGLTDSILGTWQKSKDWSQDSKSQNELKYSSVIATILSSWQSKKIQEYFPTSDFTWQEAIRYWINSDKEMAMFTLGHILHLIEDKTVPEHTRNDPHPGDSPYEIYTSQFTINNADENLNKRLNNKSPIVLSDLNSYFDELTKYSNNNFYSKDTIGIHSGYVLPEPDYINKDGIYFYGFKADKENSDYHLLAYKKPPSKYLWAFDEEITLKDEGQNFIISDYWSRLSTKSVQYGAGVINLFFQEVEKAKNDPDFVKNQESQSFFGQFIDSTKSLFAQIGGFFSGSSDNNQNFQLTDEISLNQTENQNNTLQVSASSESSDKNNKEDIVHSNILENVGMNNDNGNSNNSGNEVVQSQNTRQQLLAQIQKELDLIKIQAEQLAQEEASQSQISNQIVYSGSGGGAPVILSTGGGGTSISENSTVENQQTENQNFQQNSTSTQETLEQNTTSTISTSLGQINHIVISEIMAGVDGNPDNEFIELYNPTVEPVSLVNWSLKRKTSQSATSTKNLVANFPTSTIAAKSFFLIAHEDYIGAIAPDLIYSNNSNPLAYKDDAAILQDSVGLTIDEVNYSEISKGQSLERKAFYDNQCAIASSSGEFLGNGCDNDYDNDDDNSATDFEIREIPNQQNSQNFSEPRANPTTPQNFQIIYNASTTEMKFNWQESQDYFGATSTLIYKIINTNNATSTYYVDSRNSVPTSTLQTTSNNLSVFIDEVGRDYDFSIQAIDKEGLNSETATATISIPAFLSNLYFYRDPRPSSADYLIEAFYDQYPFIPDIYQNNANTSWKAMVFYLNSEPQKESYLDQSFSYWYPWPQETINKILKIKYDTCAGSVGAPNYVLILPDIKENCSVWGGLRNLSFNYSSENKNFAITAVSSTIDAVFTANDYLTIGYYSFYSSGWWKGLPEVFRLAAADKTKYYFQNSIPNYQSPQLNGSIAIDFDELNSKLNISWPKASDTDTVDSLITYEIQYGDLGEWQSAGNATGATKIISLGDEFSINIKAKDEFGNYSEIISTEWFYPVSPE